ncbi:Uncharacterized protein FWK35_00022236 [Aphis craccivora]|uniref:Transposable element P transposase n=1 Tax=Aphis craccivora TaxID=307492 RepID=A0A6G0Y4A5_APHCR|nr:Uncharacterized protein FWK35_00022236 [Aphis craccivora]
MMRIHKMLMTIPTSAVSKKKLFPTKENNQDDKDTPRKIKLKSIIKRQQGLLKNKRSSLFILSGVSTIKRWIGSSKFLPGYNSNLFNQIKLKTETLTANEKYCIVAFDEMKIKTVLEYSKPLDLVEGFEDLGHLGRTNKPASQALVFMARGLYSNWKLPVAYFFYTVEKLLEVGLRVKAVVCDQSTNNQAAYKDLGINNFLTGDFLFNDKLVSFKDIIKTYTIDKNSNTSKSFTKLTDSHINPGPFQKINCKLAFQIFSNSVAATIHTCVAIEELKSNTAKDTAIFVKHMNDLLDTLNTKEWNLNLQKITNKGITRPPCFNGMVWTLIAIINLYEDQKEFGFEYLMTARLNKDFLASTFSVYRQRGGYNRNPTSRTFRTTFRINSKINLIKPSSSSNYEADNDKNILTDFSTSILETTNNLNSDSDSDNNTSSLSLNCSYLTSTTDFKTNNLNKFTLEDCSNTYFAGYLGFKFINKINCGLCKYIFLKKDQYFESNSKLLIQFKSYEYKDFLPTKLMLPTDEFVNFVKLSQQIYKKTKEKNPQKKIMFNHFKRY